MITGCSIFDNLKKSVVNEIRNEYVEYEQNITVSDIEEALQKGSEIAKSCTVGVKIEAKNFITTTNASGSAVVIKKVSNSDNTYTYTAITNRHVTGTLTTTERKVYLGNQIYVDANLVAYDNEYDLAIIQFTTGFMLNVATIYSETPKVGSFAIAVGSPYDLEGFYNEMDKLLTKDLPYKTGHNYAAFNDLKDQEYDGLLKETTTSKYNSTSLAIIEAKAFDYIINGNTENGEAAVSALKHYVMTFVGSPESTMLYRESTHVLFIAAEVYDWCYDLLDDAEKEAIVARCQYIGKQYSEIGFPPSAHGAIADHGDETSLLRDWMALAIATYDEYPDIYNYVAGRYYEEFLPARNYFYKAGSHYQSSSYGAFRTSWNLYAQLLLSNMSKTDEVDSVLCEETAQIAYRWIYTRRPDGELLREGDDSHERSDDLYDWYTGTNRIYFLTSNFYKDGVLKNSKDIEKCSKCLFRGMCCSCCYSAYGKFGDIYREDPHCADRRQMYIYLMQPWLKANVLNKEEMNAT